jgi:hypothetical protein
MHVPSKHTDLRKLYFKKSLKNETIKESVVTPTLVTGFLNCGSTKRGMENWKIRVP